MNKMNAPLFKLLATSVLLSFSALAGASSVTWNLTDSSTYSSELTAGYTDTDGNYIKATAFSSGTNSTFEETILLVLEKGLSVNETGSEGAEHEHGISSASYHVDAVLFDFGREVTLHAVTMGWAGFNNEPGVSDISVLALTDGSIDGETISDLSNSNIWVENFPDVWGQTNHTQTITPSDASQYWLISAFDYGYTEPDGDWTNEYEQFKISSIEVSAAPIEVSAVPIPAAAWLFCSALLGLMGLSRRKKAQS